MPEGLFYQVPTWAITLGAFIAMIGGTLIGERLWRKRPTDDRASTEEGYIVSGVVGLLALLLGFTFALAVDRFESRRMLVVEEANALRTTYLRAQTFGDPHRARLDGLLAAYARNRLALGELAPGDEFMRLATANADLQRRLWTASLAAIATQRDDISSAYMDSMNHVFEVAGARRAARAARVPPRTFVILVLYMVASAVVFGYVIGPRRRRAIIALMALTSMTYGLILDIDNSTGGAIRESQRPMRDLLPQLVPPDAPPG